MTTLKKLPYEKAAFKTIKTIIYFINVRYADSSCDDDAYDVCGAYAS